MSFTIYLQRNNSRDKTINKSITNIVTVTGNLREETSLTDPTITFELSMSDCRNINYVTIPEFGRSYFVTEPISVRNGLIELKLHVDVLESFKSEILNNGAIVSRSSNQYNKYLVDDKLQTYTYNLARTKAFTNPFTKNLNFVLSLVGGD